MAYDTDIAKAKDVLNAVAMKCPDGLDTPPRGRRKSASGEFRRADLKVWCKTSKYFDVKYYLEEEVKAAFDEASIIIPYPRMDVRVRAIFREIKMGEIKNSKEYWLLTEEKLQSEFSGPAANWE